MRASRTPSIPSTTPAQGLVPWMTSTKQLFASGVATMSGVSCWSIPGLAYSEGLPVRRLMTRRSADPSGPLRA